MPSGQIFVGSIVFQMTNNVFWDKEIPISLVVWESFEQEYWDLSRDASL